MNKKIKNQHQINKKNSIKLIETNLTKKSMYNIVSRVLGIIKNTDYDAYEEMSKDEEYLKRFFNRITNHWLNKEYKKDQYYFSIFYYALSLDSMLEDEISFTSHNFLIKKCKYALNKITPEIKNTILELI